MLDVIVLIAMAVTALAFAVGLIVQSGIAQIPALIAAAALYLVMAASYLMLARGARPTASTDRLSEVEAALEIIDKDLQRIDRVEDDVSRLDLLADRVERLDQALSEYAATAPIGGLGRPDHVGNEFDEVHAKIELRARRSRERGANAAGEDHRRSQGAGESDQAALARVDRRPRRPPKRRRRRLRRYSHLPSRRARPPSSAARLSPWCRRSSSRTKSKTNSRRRWTRRRNCRRVRRRGGDHPRRRRGRGSRAERRRAGRRGDRRDRDRAPRRRQRDA